MLATDALRQSVKAHLAPALRAEGFRGTYPTWRLAHGDDVAVVSIWADKYNQGASGQFFLSTAVVTPAWWAWTHECEVGHLRGSTSRAGREHEWDGLYRNLVRPPRTSKEHWEIGSPEDADRVALAMRERLQQRELLRLRDLMGPGRLLAAVRAGRIDGQVWALDRPGMREVVLAVLLTDVGGAELEDACHALDELARTDPHPEVFARTARWARARVA